MEKNMKKAPKNPPAESIRRHVSTRVTGERGRGEGFAVVQILVKLLDTAFCCALVMASRPKSLLKLFCVMVVPIKAES